MNNRIKELAKQAGDYVNEVYKPPVRSKTPGKIWEDGHIDWHTQFNQKFTELILQDIDKIVDNLYHSLPLEQAAVLLTLDENIKEHFYGVDE